MELYTTFERTDILMTVNHLNHVNQTFVYAFYLKCLRSRIPHMIFLYTLVRSFLVGFAFLLNDEAYQLQDLRAPRILHSHYVHLPHSIYHIISPGFAFYPK